MDDAEIRFEVTSYNISKVHDIIASLGTADLEYIQSKPQVLYLDEYLNDIGAKTILHEQEYIDQDYLEDYSGYYARCFNTYDRYCSRIHLFSLDFTQDDFQNLLKRKNDKLYNELSEDGVYLGFIVIKPLPRTFIGRTCLKPYSEEEEGKRRKYPTKRRYITHPFGIKLRIKSLAFQEQDQAVAACATSALWSVFHNTGLQYQHPIPSPLEITKAATSNTPIDSYHSDSRRFPNEGLTVPQMAFAIKSVGLEPSLVQIKDEVPLKNIVYAYLSAKIPIVLGVIIINTADNSFAGLHAVTVTGFSLGDSGASFSRGGSSIFLKALRMNKIYVHDDQVGPFAKMLFDGIKTSASPSPKVPVNNWSMSTSYGKPTVHRMIPYCALIPLYHKIRLRFSDIREITLKCDSVVKPLLAIAGLLRKENLEWDIHLTTVNDLRDKAYANLLLDSQSRKLILEHPLPRFIWKVSVYYCDNPIIDILFDATDLPQGNYFLKTIKFNNTFSKSHSPIFDLFFNKGIWRQ